MAQWISARLPNRRPGFNSGTCRLVWVEFVVRSRVALRRGFFSWFTGFLPSTKTNTYKFQFDLNAGGRRKCPYCYAFTLDKDPSINNFQVMLASSLKNDYYHYYYYHYYYYYYYSSNTFLHHIQTLTNQNLFRIKIR